MKPTDNRRNEPESILVERVVPGGRGFARLPDGRPVFLSGGLPGDRVRLTQVRDRGSFLESLRLEVLEPGPHRTAPLCSVADRCGGCDLMAAALESQLEFKRSILLEALERTGRFSGADLPAVPRLVRSAKQFGYRNRIRLSVKGGRLGFLEPGSSTLVCADPCHVADAPVWELALKLREVIANRPSLFSEVEWVEVRVLPEWPREPAPSRERASVFFRLAGQRQSSLPALPELTQLSVVTDNESRTPHFQRYYLNEDTYVLVSPGGFCQVNEAINREMISYVLKRAQAARAESFLDLYSGSGNFSLPLSRLGLSGDGLESSEVAIQAAQQGAAEQGMGNVRFRATSVESHLAAGNQAPADIVIVDPPRRGAKEILCLLPRLVRKLLVMVSCDPVTLARDLRGLVDLGFRIEEIQGFDMFPGTHHLETVVVLSAPVQSSP